MYLLEGLEGICLCEDHGSSQLMSNFLHCLGLIVLPDDGFVQVPHIQAWPYFWEVLMLVDSEAAARVSGAAETIDYFR